MTDENLSDVDILRLEGELLSVVPPDSAVGNVTLFAALEQKGWSDNQYWSIRNRLIDKGQLARGKGRGGSVRRLQVEVQAEVNALPEESAFATTERELYTPLKSVLEDRWAVDFGLDSYWVEITATSGPRTGEGKWTRPDIAIAGYKTYPYVPGKHFDLITFEVKHFTSLDVTNIYEALGHRRAATRSYALIYIPDRVRDSIASVLEEVCLEAKKFGIGVIVAESPDAYDKWEELVEATRHEPDPERLNNFLAKNVSLDAREKIMKWFK